MLNGYLKPNSGTIYYEGQEIKFGSARHAVKKNIHTIYQNFSLIDLFTVKENLSLVFPDKSAGELKDMINRYGKNVDLDTRVALLPAGVKQRLEITRALESDAKVLLLDEPTSVLAYEERDKLFRDLAKLGQERGLAILITTHKLQDVMDYCHRVTVLKAGRLVLEKSVSETSLKELAVAMFGASEELEESAAAGTGLNEADKTLEVKDLSVRGDNVHDRRRERARSEQARSRPLRAARHLRRPSTRARQQPQQRRRRLQQGGRVAGEPRARDGAEVPGARRER